MKKIVTSLFLLFLTLTSVMAQLPSVKVENAKGEKVPMTSFIDHKTPIIISFWATTCKPCLRELDTINELMPDWKEQANFRVIAVSIDDSRSTDRAHALVEGRGWEDFTVIYDKNQDLMRAMNVSLTPQAFVVDPDGKIVYSHTGYTPGSEAELLKAVLKAQKK